MNSINFKIVVGILSFIAINFIASKFFYRLDLTENGEFTLSKATKDIVKNLEEKVKVTAYFSDDLHVDLDKRREELKDLLNEYANASKGNLEFEFKAPNSDPKIEEEAMKAGVQPVMIQQREKDQSKQQKAFLGAVVSIDERKEVIPFIQPGTSMEYALTTNIKKLAVKDKPVIGFIQGHGETAIQELAQVYQSLQILYQIESVYLSDTVNLSKYKTLVMIRPKDSIPAKDFTLLDNFLQSGKNLYLAFNHVDANLQYGMTTVMHTGISQWLQSKGLTTVDALVRDVSCGSVQVQQQSDFFSFATPVQLPYLPLIQKFSDHPSTKGLERVIIQFASPLQYSTNNKYNFIPVLYSSPQSAFDSVPITFDINRQWLQSEFNMGSQCIGGVLEDKTTLSKIIVYSDGDFPIGGGKGQQVNEDNVSLLSNGIDWLSDDTGLIDLRTKAIATRPIDELTDSKRSMYKYLNLLLPIGLAILYGVYRSSTTRRKRIQLMQEKFI